jgi:hypothetical protein
MNGEMMNSRNTFIAIAILAAALTSEATTAHAVTQTSTGVVSDSMCMKKHMMPGRSDAECIKECVKAGSSYVLVAGDKIYELKGKPASIAPFAGKRVTVQGQVDQKRITVNSIH